MLKKENKPDAKVDLHQSENNSQIKSGSHKVLQIIRDRFFEFFMLFLAVFCGFMTDNFRENLSENQREKVFIKSIVEDFKSDTLESKNVLTRLIARQKGIDSAVTELMNPKTLKSSYNFYRLWIQNMGVDFFVSNDRTIRQLKNSGELRLIRNKAVSDRIMNYDQIITKYYTQSNLMLTALPNMTSNTQILDFISLQKKNGLPVPLLKQDKVSLNQVYSHLFMWNRALGGLVSWLEDINKEAKDLLLFIKKEYHLV